MTGSLKTKGQIWEQHLRKGLFSAVVKYPYVLIEKKQGEVGNKEQKAESSRQLFRGGWAALRQLFLSFFHL